MVSPVIPILGSFASAASAFRALEKMILLAFRVELVSLELSCVVLGPSLWPSFGWPFSWLGVNSIVSCSLNEAHQTKGVLT